MIPIGTASVISNQIQNSSLCYPMTDLSSSVIATTVLQSALPRLGVATAASPLFLAVTSSAVFPRPRRPSSLSGSASSPLRGGNGSNHSSDSSNKQEEQKERIGEITQYLATEGQRLTKEFADRWNMLRGEVEERLQRQLQNPPPPRAKSCILMAIAMALHFGGYEFARSAALALFTSSSATGFSHPSAYPFAIGLVTPVSLVLLYWYGTVLKAHGPRRALKLTSFLSVSVLSFCTILLKLLEMLGSGTVAVAAGTAESTPSTMLALLAKTVVGTLFVFQNSYAHLLYTQQWSFLGSVMTPSEGTKWFSTIAGLSSLVCTFTATLVRHLAPVVGLLGLIVGTCLTLTMSLLTADQAYHLSEVHGFDPSETIQQKQKDKESQQDEVGTKNGQNKKPDDHHHHSSSSSLSSSLSSSSSLIAKTTYLFQRVPTLAALFCEVISFQSLSTVLNICMVRQLKESGIGDTERASFTGRLYSYINGISGLMQFFVLPMARKYMEPQWVYKAMPMLLLPLLLYSAIALHSTTSAATLWMTAATFFCLKTVDYSLRNVVNEMVYQPLDFESRYVGKEVIGVFANRFGKSGMSMILSFMTATFPSIVGVPSLATFAVIVGSFWTSCSFWLSRNVMTNQEADRQVSARQNNNNNNNKGQKHD